jgi:hypothetical protein
MDEGTDKKSFKALIIADYHNSHKDNKNIVGLSRCISRANSDIMSRHGWNYNREYCGNLVHELWDEINFPN